MFKLAFLLLGCFAISNTYSSAVYPYNWVSNTGGCQSCNTQAQSTWPSWSGWPNMQNWWYWPSWQNQLQTQWQYPSQQQWQYPSQQQWQYPSYYQWPQVPTPTAAPTPAPTVVPPPTPVDYAVDPALPVVDAAAPAPTDPAAVYIQPFTGPTEKAKSLKEGGGVRGIGSAASSIPFWWALNWCFMPSNMYTMPCRCLFSYIEYCWMEPKPHPLCKCENVCKWW